MIIIPEKKQAAVDVMDEALSILRVVYCAVGNDEGIDPLYLRETIGQIDEKLKPLREALKRAHGKGQEIG